MIPYARRRYTGRRIAGGLRNIFWSTLLIVITVLIVGACAYGCARYFNVMEHWL